MPPRTKLTDAQERALRGLRDHDEVSFYFHTMSQQGGLTQTLASLHRKGLIAHDDTHKIVLTDAGRQALTEQTSVRTGQ